MSARDDYPYPLGQTYHGAVGNQWHEMCDEIDRLRARVALLGEVLNEQHEWTVHWFGVPYEGWDAVLAPECYHDTTAADYCYCCDGDNVTAEQVEALRSAGVHFAEIGEPSCAPDEVAEAMT